MRVRISEKKSNKKINRNTSKEKYLKKARKKFQV